MTELPVWCWHSITKKEFYYIGKQISNVSGHIAGPVAIVVFSISSNNDSFYCTANRQTRPTNVGLRRLQTLVGGLSRDKALNSSS